MIQPEIKEIEQIELLKHHKIELRNGLPLYYINAGKQPLVKVDVLFDAGNSQAQDPVLPAAVNALLDDGCRRYNSGEIASIIDGKGAFYVPSIQKDFAQTSLYLLNKFSKDLLPLYVEMINESVFPEEEVLMYQRNMKQRFLVEHGKVNVQSHQAFVNALFGENSIYSDLSSAASYDQLNRDSILQFYENRVERMPSGIIVSGLVDDALLNDICSEFEQFEWEEPVNNNPLIVYGESAARDQWVRIQGKENQQVSMRIGRPTVNAKHPDYWGLSLLSTVLGGYFGSRLNKVIREEKGLTYGIHSHITNLAHANFLSIHAELNASNWEEAYQSVIEIFDDLKNKPIPQEEMDMVRKYIKGSLLQSIDGALAYSSYLRNTLVFDLEVNRVNEYIHFLDSVQANELMRLAKYYLNEKSFYKIVAGV
jgi:predicted Zn-dependent peptidase